MQNDKKPSLKKRFFYTAMTNMLNILVGFAVQLFLTPILVEGLGQRGFALYSLVNKLQGYFSLTDFRPTAILRYKISLLQSSQERDKKRQLVGAALVVGAASFVPIIILGYCMGLLSTNLFAITNLEAEQIRLAILYVAAFMGIKPILGIPDAIIRGNNYAFWTYYVDPARALVYVLLSLYSIAQGWEVIGIVMSLIAASVFDQALRFLIVKNKLSGYSPLIPSVDLVKEFFNKGGWYLGSSLLAQALNSFDIFLVGYLYGLEALTAYTITKAMLFRVSEAIASIVSSSSSGLGYVIGEGDKEKARRLRLILYRYSLIIGIFVGSYFALFNYPFIKLWVGEENYAGPSVNAPLIVAALLMVIVVGEETFVNLSQRYNRKSVIIGMSLLASLLATAIAVRFVGIAGIAFAVFVGKAAQLVLYWMHNNAGYKITALTGIGEAVKVIYLVIPFVVCSYFGINNNIDSWSSLIKSSALYVVLYVFVFLAMVMKEEDMQFIKGMIKVGKA